MFVLRERERCEDFLQLFTSSVVKWEHDGSITAWIALVVHLIVVVESCSP